MPFLDDTGLARLVTKIKEKFATKDVATSAKDGLMSASDKTILNGLDPANNDPFDQWSIDVALWANGLGRAMLPDPALTQANTLDLNGIAAYRGTIELVPRSDDNPYTESPYEILVKKPESESVTSTYYGISANGHNNAGKSRSSVVQLVRVCAKVPEGTYVSNAGNSQGTGGRASRLLCGDNIHVFNGSNPIYMSEGTGYFKDYWILIFGGIDGTFASNAYFQSRNLSGLPACEEFRIAYVQIYDLTATPGGDGDLVTPYRPGLVDFDNAAVTGINLLRRTRDFYQGVIANPSLSPNAIIDGYRGSLPHSTRTVDEEGFVVYRTESSGLTANFADALQWYAPKKLVLGKQYTFSIELMIEDIAAFDVSNRRIGGFRLLKRGTGSIVSTIFITLDHCKNAPESGKWVMLSIPITVLEEDTFLNVYIGQFKNGAVNFRKPRLYEGSINNPIWSPSPFDTIETSDIATPSETLAYLKGSPVTALPNEGILIGEVPKLPDAEEPEDTGSMLPLPSEGMPMIPMPSEGTDSTDDIEDTDIIDSTEGDE